MEIIYSKNNTNQSKYLENFNEENAIKVNNFHKSFDEYESTPLVELNELSKYLKVKNIYVKDESYRFGLNAFKVLGGSYSVAKYISKVLNKDISELPYHVLTSDEIKNKLGDLTFITTTDGNHGRGIAWTANRLKQKAIVYMPKGSAIERLENIRKLGAHSEILDMNYDDCVRYSNCEANKYGYILVQDTAWEGYEEIPLWIMQGYMSMAYEAVNQIKQKPTHVFLQAGVGAMSGAVTAYLRNTYGDNIKIIIVEPKNAACIYESARAGSIQFVKGDLQTIMAGLSCGEPCSIGWDILDTCATAYVSMEDEFAAKGMRVLGSPIGNDTRIISGESGACTLGFVSEILSNSKYEDIKKQLGINENAVILCFSTEGDTDQENYRKIVWDGSYPINK